MHVVIAIGNTDNRLTQQEWSRFTSDINEVIQRFGKIHFFGGPPNWYKWQNVSWIAETQLNDIEALITAIASTREYYRQDSAMVMYGEAKFI